MASDFSSRIGARSGTLTTRDRPTPDDIDELRRRQEEHHKRTQAAPKTKFDSYLQRQGQQGEHGADDQGQTGHTDEAAPDGAAPQSPQNAMRGGAVKRPILPPTAGGKGRIIRG